MLQKLRAGMPEVASGVPEEKESLVPPSGPSEAALRIAEHEAAQESALMRGQSEEGLANSARNLFNSTLKSISQNSTKGEVTSNVSSTSFFDEMEKPVENMMKTVSKKTSIPFWAVFIIFIVIAGVFALVFFCCLQRWWRKFRGKEGGKGFMGGKVDLKSVQLLGQAYKEKVQPDMDELTKDMEQNEAGKEDGKEEVKLGRLQFKIDYDFNQSNVRLLLLGCHMF